MRPLGSWLVRNAPGNRSGGSIRSTFMSLT